MAKQTFTTGQVLTAAQMTSLQQTAMGGGSTTAKTASYVLVAADAGTVVQMNAAGATTITVNTALFAAGDSVQIQNIGAGVCTVTAGTATVSTAGSLALSQYEGGQLYFNTTSAALFFDIVQTSGMTNPMTTTGDIIYSSSGSTPARLGIGTTGQVVTVASGLPAWATPATGSFVGCSVTRTNTSTVITNATNYMVAFNTENYDTDAFHDNTTNNSRITIPTGKGGKYYVNTQFNNALGSIGAYAIIRIYLNGAQIAQGYREGFVINGPGSSGNASSVLTLAAGDYIEMGYQQGNTETVNMWFVMSATYLGA